MEIFNSCNDFGNLTLLKQEFKTEPEADQNLALSVQCDPPIKQECFIKEEIDIDWDENFNIHGKGNELLSESNNEVLKLNNGINIDEPSTNKFSQAEKKRCNNNLKIRKFQTKKNKEKFECKVCLKHFNSRHGITRHLDTKCNIQGYYQCSDCNYKSPIRYQIRNHLKRIHHFSESNIDGKITWNKISSNKGKVNIHNCSKCQREFGSYRSLSYHSKCCVKSISKICEQNKDTIIEGFENKDSVRKMAIYYCVKCKKDIKISDFLTRDQNYCFDCKSKLVFKCVKCKKQYGLYSSIVYHLKSVCNPKTSLQCSECEYTAPLISLINKHYRMTHDRQVSYCSSCGGQYKNPESLRKHLYNCTRTFNYYNCNDCDYNTKVKLRLTHHIQVMHLEKDENEKLINN